MPPPKGGGRPKLFGRPDALLVDSDGPRISMPPPPPVRAEVVAPPIVVVPAPEEPTGEGPARVFIGLPGKAPQPRIATPTWDEENTDERGRDEADEPTSFGVAAFAASGPAVLPKGQVSSLTLGLDRSVVSPRVAAPPPPVPEDSGFRRPGSPVLRLAATLDADEEEESPRPAAVAATPPPPPTPAPVPRPTVTREPVPLWEGLPESEPAPRPVVPVRRPLRTSPELTPPPTPPPPVFTPPGRAPNTVSPTGFAGEPPRTPGTRPALGRVGSPPPSPGRPGAPPPPGGRPGQQSRPTPIGPPPREPMPLRPPAPGTAFPPPGGRRDLPKTDPRELPFNGEPGGGLLPWALLAIGLSIAAGGLWFFGYGPGKDGMPSARPAPVTEIKPTPPPERPKVEEPVIPIPATPPTEPLVIETPPVDRTAILGTGMLSIEADRKAVIYVDGVKRGTTPELGPFEISAGEHTVRAVAGKQSRTQTVRVDEGAANKLAFDFTK